MKNIIEIQNINKFFGEGENRVHILKDISISIEKGDFVSIIGQSGSGKSTLMNIIGCLDKATSGKYYIDGEEISGFSHDELSELRKKKFGFIFQRYHLLTSLNAQENVALPAIYAGVEHDERMKRAEKLLDKLELSTKLKNKPNQLSGGQQQRVALARTLNQNPSIILADEPVASLDPIMADVVMSDFARINKEMNISILLNIHHVDLALKYATRVIGVRSGHIVYDGPTDKITKEILDEVYNGKVIPTSKDDAKEVEGK